MLRRLPGLRGPRDRHDLALPVFIRACSDESPRSLQQKTPDGVIYSVAGGGPWTTLDLNVDVSQFHTDRNSTRMKTTITTDGLAYSL